MRGIVERPGRSWKSPSVLSRPKGPYRRAGTTGTGWRLVGVARTRESKKSKDDLEKSLRPT